MKSKIWGGGLNTRYIFIRSQIDQVLLGVIWSGKMRALTKFKGLGPMRKGGLTSKTKYVVHFYQK